MTLPAIHLPLPIDSDSESESDGNADFQSVCGISEHSKPSKETPSKLCISVMIGQACGTVICDLKVKLVI